MKIHSPVWVNTSLFLSIALNFGAFFSATSGFMFLSIALVVGSTMLAMLAMNARCGECARPMLKNRQGLWFPYATKKCWNCGDFCESEKIPGGEVNSFQAKFYYFLAAFFGFGALVVVWGIFDGDADFVEQITLTTILFYLTSITCFFATWPRVRSGWLRVVNRAAGTIGVVLSAALVASLLIAGSWAEAIFLSVLVAAFIWASKHGVNNEAHQARR